MKVMIKINEQELFGDFLPLEHLSPIIDGNKNLLLRFIEKVYGQAIILEMPGTGNPYLVKPGEKVTIEFKA